MAACEQVCRCKGTTNSSDSLLDGPLGVGVPWLSTGVCHQGTYTLNPKP